MRHAEPGAFQSVLGLSKNECAQNRYNIFAVKRMV